MSTDERDQWRQELIDRQRNVVFPDTVRNEGRFLRGIVYNRGRLNRVQRIGVGIVGLTSLFGASLFAATSIGEIVESRSLFWAGASVVSGLMALLSFAVAFKLIFVAVFPGKPDGQGREERE